MRITIAKYLIRLLDWLKNKLIQYIEYLETPIVDEVYPTYYDEEQDIQENDAIGAMLYEADMNHMLDW